MNQPLQKLLTLSELSRRVVDSRKNSERIIFTSGCFDLIHVGHVRSLRAARALGDRLIIGLNSDESVRALNSIACDTQSATHSGT